MGVPRSFLQPARIGRTEADAPWEPVSSSNLAAVRWFLRGPDGVLQIRFRTSGAYEYTGVPKTRYQGLLRAYSKGKYFDRHVKHAYPFSKVG